ESLSRYGEIESLRGCTARLIVRREALTQTVSQLLEDLDVQDLTVSDPPVEEVIGRVFEAGAIRERKKSEQQAPAIEP
ncbi:MAG: hypothetical protein AAFW95_02905, partial [Cyanobacteria bacterium J06638_6]